MLIYLFSEFFYYVIKINKYTYFHTYTHIANVEMIKHKFVLQSADQLYISRVK